MTAQVHEHVDAATTPRLRSIFVHFKLTSMQASATTRRKAVTPDRSPLVLPVTPLSPAASRRRSMNASNGRDQTGATRNDVSRHVRLMRQPASRRFRSGRQDATGANAGRQVGVWQQLDGEAAAARRGRA